MSYSHSRKPDLPITHSSHFSMGFVMAYELWGSGFCFWLGNIAIATVLPLSYYCVLYCKHGTVYGISLFVCLGFNEASGSAFFRLTLARGVVFMLSVEYSEVTCWVWSGTLLT